jgi:hypothetical protein
VGVHAAGDRGLVEPPQDLPDRPVLGTDHEDAGRLGIALTRHLVDRVHPPERRVVAAERGVDRARPAAQGRLLLPGDIQEQAIDVRRPQHQLQAA